MFGQYAAFIIPSYVVSAAVILALLVWIRFQHKSRRDMLAELEAAGMRRRSDKNS